MSFAKWWLPFVAAINLFGCASVPADRGLGDVQVLLREHGTPMDQDGASGDNLDRSAQLTLDRAVAIALMHNPELRMEYARLGLAQADVFEASRLSNPEVSLSALNSNTVGEGVRLGYGLAQNFTDLLLLRARGNQARAEMDQEKARVAERIRSLAGSVRTAAVEAISAAQVAAMRDIVARSAQASAELALRFFQAGNINELELNREQAAATEATLAADAARAQVDSLRWRLNRLMGLNASDNHWTLSESLPQPVQSEDTLDGLQTLALERRLDLKAKRQEVAGAGVAADLVRRWRWLPFLAIGVEGERDADGTHLIGPALSLELPVFNQGQGRVLRAQVLLELVQAELTQLELDIQAEVAGSYGRMLAARDRALRHVRELIPQRESVVARTQEMQNYMLVGQFELILARQQEYDAYQSYLESVRDYWLARADLEHAIGTALPSDARIGTETVTPLPFPESAPDAGHDH